MVYQLTCRDCGLVEEHETLDDVMDAYYSHSEDYGFHRPEFEKLDQ